jgi:fatty acid-binding protein DegV
MKKVTAISSRSLEQAWLEQHHAEYAGAWVALEGARLIAQGASAREVLDTARSAGYDQPLIVHVPSEPQLPFGGW